VGVDSNFLVADGKVFFAQADGSLTALDLQTGAVVARLTDGDYSGRLKRIDDAILVHAYRNVTLLNLDALTPQWSMSKPGGIYSLNITSGYLIAADGNGSVECRDLISGDVRWTYDLPGAVDIVAVKEHVLIHQHYDKYPIAIALLELGTGRELYRREPPADMEYLKAYFDGEHAYLATGTASKGGSTRSTPYDLGATCDHIVTWDLFGGEIARSEAPVSIYGRTSYDLDREDFTVADKRFTARGLVYPIDSPCPDVGPLATRGTQPETPMQLPDGFIHVVDAVEDREHQCAAVVERMSSDRGWRGYLPYVGENGCITHTSLTGDFLLLGSNSGHVECVDADTGRSRWLYVFPAIDQMASFSFPYGMPPYYADRARRFRRAIERNRNVTGMIPIPATFSENEGRWSDIVASAGENRPRLIPDPNPSDPFDDLPYLLAEEWMGAAGPILILMLVFLETHRRGRKLPHVAVASLWAAAMVYSGANLIFSHRIAFSSTTATKVVVVCSAFFLLVYVGRLFKERRMLVASLYLSLLIVCTYLLYLPLLYV